MTQLLRRIADARAWRQFERDPDLLQNDPPIWTYGEFTPSSRDGGMLSVYEVVDTNEAREVLASALLMVFDEAHLFVAVPTEAVTKAGFELIASPGKTFDDEVNGWHREIAIARPSDIETVTKLFFVGAPHRFGKDRPVMCLRRRAASGSIQLTAAFRTPSPEGPRRWVGELICSDAAALVPGVPPGTRAHRA